MVELNIKEVIVYEIHCADCGEWDEISQHSLHRRKCTPNVYFSDRGWSAKEVSDGYIENYCYECMSEYKSQ